MKKAILSLLGMLAFTFTISAQLNGEWCGFDYKLEQALQADPALEQQLHDALTLATSPHEIDGPEATKIVPVVVHILHDDGIGNISYEQVQDALDVLNIDYNRLNADTADTRDTPTAPFKQHAASMDIEFRLARIDPQGNCTNGVIRYNVPDHATYDVDMTSEPHKHASSGGADAWPRNKYFNIWVINSIESGGGQGIVGGYAQFPYFGSANEYGVVVRHDFFGTIGTALGEDGGVLTHELGHCLGLYHIFQGGCHSNNCNSNGDWCCDTPPQEQAFFNCSQTLNSCSQVPSGGDPYGFDALDQIENYMSYNTCWNMFSYDQAAIMESIFTDYSWAQQLISAANVAYTGVDVPDVLCEADFSASKTSVCVGETIDFTDESFNAVNGWTWTFTGGTPNASSSQNPSIQYNTPGLYEVILTSTDGTNNDTETKTSFIRVLPAPSTVPFLETFESFSTLQGIEEWEVLNHSPGTAEFEISTTVGHSGTQSAVLPNFGESSGNFDELVSSPVDLTSITSQNGMTLSFRYAYSKRQSGNDEWLKVYCSADCGDNWAPRKTLHGDLLGSNVASSSWTPTAADWVTVHMTNITSNYWVDNFKYKFEFESDGGNNFYLDNINIYPGSPSNDLVVGVEEQAEFGHLTLFPNPTEDELNVRFDLNNAQQVEFYVQDISGKIVKTNYIQATAGANLVVLGTEELASGMYFLKVNAGGTQQSIQFVVK